MIARAIGSTLISVVLLGLVSVAGRAQETSVPSMSGAASSATSPRAAQQTKAGSFDMLAPGDRKIARALFLAQHPRAKGPAPLSLNQIADLKGQGGWAKVFKQMQAEGLIQAKNLGQVVSGYEHHLRSDAAARPRGGAVLVTNAQGGVSGSSRGGGVAHGGDKIASDRNVAVAVAADSASPNPPQQSH